MSTTPGQRSYQPPTDEAPANISVIGVGGGGCNAVMRMLRAKPVPGVRYIAANTDIKSLQHVKGAQIIQIGDSMTHGMGAGGNPEIGAKAAEGDRKAVQDAIAGADLVFLTAGMGGGTGTGAAPIIAAAARETGALVVGVVTTPFSFEGGKRRETANLGVSRLREQVDNIIVIHNDRLLALLNEDVSMEEALQRADEAVMMGVLSVAELVNLPGEINVDLADVKSIMKLPGAALMAIGEGHGPGGALKASEQAANNPLLDIGIDGAGGVLFNVNGGKSLKLGEVNAAGEYIRGLVDPNATIFFGMVNDEAQEDRTRLTLIATGIPTRDDQVATREASYSHLLTSTTPHGGEPDLDLPPFLRNSGQRR